AVADDERLGAVVQLVPGAAVAPGQVPLAPRRPGQNPFVLLLQRQPGLPEAVDDHSLRQLAMAGEFRHHGDRLGVSWAELHPCNPLAEADRLGPPAEEAAVGSLVVPQDRGRPRPAGEELQDLLTVRTAVEDVADGQDPIAGAEASPVEQVQQLRVAAVNGADHQAPRHYPRASRKPGAWRRPPAMRPPMGTAVPAEVPTR